MKKLFKAIICGLLFIGGLGQSFAQDITGTEFWFTATGGRYFIDQSTKLMIVGNYDATISIDWVALNHNPAFTNEFNCTRDTVNHVGGTVTTVVIPSDNLAYCARYVDNLENPETIQDNGARIKSSAPIAVYYTHYEPASGEATPLHPIDQLGTDYIITAFRENSNDTYWAALSTIIATEDNTTITIELTNETWTSSGDYRAASPDDITDTVVLHKPNDVWSITMNRGQTYSLVSLQDGALGSSNSHNPWGSVLTNAQNTGLNGVKITANKKVSVFGGSPITRIGDYEYAGCSAGDITYTNLLPTNEWGTSFVATQTLLRTYNITSLKNPAHPRYPNWPASSADKSTADYLLITARDNNTNVTIGGRSSFTYSLNEQEYFIYESPGKSAAAALNPGQVQNTITADKPISVVQLMKGGYCDGAAASNGGDPDQMWVFREDSWSDNYLMSNPVDYSSNFIVLIVKEPSGGSQARNSIVVTQNGANVPIPAGNSTSPLNDGTGGWSQMGTSGYYFQRVQLGTVGVPIRAKSVAATPGGQTYPFAFYLSGGLGAGSYGFMGGASCRLEAFAGVNSNPSCEGNPVIFGLDSTRNGGVVGGAQNYNYTWEVFDGTTSIHTSSGVGNNPSHTYTPPSGGNYTVILDITDIAGCNARDTFQISVVPLPDINPIGDQVACNSYTMPAITGTNLTGNEAYFTNPGGVGTPILPGSSVNTSGTYYAYDGGAACFDEESFDIQINTSPTVDPATIVETCNGANTEYTLSFDVAGGDGGPYTVTEIAPGGTGGSFTGNTYNTDPSNPIASGTAYHFEITDAGGCPAAVVSGSNTCGCASDAGTMDVSPMELCGDGTQTANAGTIAPNLEADDAENFVLHTSSGGTLGTVLDQASTSSFAFNAPMSYGTTYYISRVVGNDQGGGVVDLNDPCLSVASGTPVVWNEAITAQISNGGAICFGETGDITFTMTGPGPFNIVYDNQSSNQNISNVTSPHTRSVTPSSTTTYTIVSVTSIANGCEATSSVGNSTNLVVNENPIADASAIETICVGEVLQLNGAVLNNVSNPQYSWTGPGGFSSNQQNPTIPNANINNSGQYTLTVTSNTCTDSDIVDVLVNPRANAQFSAELLNSIKEPHHYQFNNSSLDAISYEWNFGDGSISSDSDPNHQYEITTGELPVTLIARGQGGCDDSITVFVSLLVIPDNDTVEIYLPNTFTPDGNEFNQYLKPVFNESVDPNLYTMKVFNRWGELIFETNDVNVGWDGAYQNAASPSGAYAWEVSFTDKHTFKKYRYSGQVFLLR